MTRKHADNFTKEDNRIFSLFQTAMRCKEGCEKALETAFSKAEKSALRRDRDYWDDMATKRLEQLEQNRL